MFAMHVRELVQCVKNLFDPVNYYIYLLVFLCTRMKQFDSNAANRVRVCVTLLGKRQLFIRYAYGMIGNYVCNSCVNVCDTVLKLVSCIVLWICGFRYSMHISSNSFPSFLAYCAGREHAMKMKTSCLSFLFIAFHWRSHV